MKNNFRAFFYVMMVFVIIALINFSFTKQFSAYGIKVNILHASNIFLLCISTASIFMQSKAIHNKNPNVFVRAVMGGMLLKMMGCGAAVLFYYFVSGEDFSKSSVVVSLIFYLIYLTTEVIVMTKLNKGKHA